MQPRNFGLRHSKQLLVEGREEQFFFDAFLRHLGINDVQIQNCGGKDNLRAVLRTVAGSLDFPLVSSIGIVRDADDNAQSALQSVQDSLGNTDLPVPQSFLTPAGESPTVSVFIMPDNYNNGALEHLCLSAAEQDPAMHCVEEFLACIHARVPNPPQDSGKSRIHAFLASRVDPELRLGEAAQRGYIDWTHPAFNDLAQFLRNL